MFDSFKNAAKIGMGAIWLSKENLKKLTDELAEMGKASREEGEKLFKEFEKNSEEYKQRFNEHVENTVQRALDQAGLVRKSDLEDLQRKLADLEERLKAEQGGAGDDRGE